MNSDHWSRGRGQGPLDHHHGPTNSSLVYKVYWWRKRLSFNKLSSLHRFDSSNSGTNINIQPTQVKTSFNNNWQVSFLTSKQRLSDGLSENLRSKFPREIGFILSGKFHKSWRWTGFLRERSEMKNPFVGTKFPTNHSSSWKRLNQSAVKFSQLRGGGGNMGENHNLLISGSSIQLKCYLPYC